jgi:hypothetical protein
MDSFDFKGFWWLLNNPSEKLAGICSFTPFQGGELEISKLALNNQYM